MVKMNEWLCKEVNIMKKNHDYFTVSGSLYAGLGAFLSASDETNPSSKAVRAQWWKSTPK
jgi:hypothetical protein